jgi:chorismate mutase
MNRSKYPVQEKDLAELRRELDRLDAALLEAVRLRIEQCVVIGKFKQANGIPVMQPERMGIVQERAQVFARENSLDPAFLRGVYDLVIAEACRLEELAIAELESGTS